MGNTPAQASFAEPWGDVFLAQKVSRKILINFPKKAQETKVKFFAGRLSWQTSFTKKLHCVHLESISVVLKGKRTATLQKHDDVDDEQCLSIYFKKDGKDKELNLIIAKSQRDVFYEKILTEKKKTEDFAKYHGQLKHQLDCWGGQGSVKDSMILFKDDVKALLDFLDIHVNSTHYVGNLNELFDSIDQNKNGQVDFVDFMVFMKGLIMQREDLIRMWPVVLAKDYTNVMNRGGRIASGHSTSFVTSVDALEDVRNQTLSLNGFRHFLYEVQGETNVIEEQARTTLLRFCPEGQGNYITFQGYCGYINHTTNDAMDPRKATTIYQDMTQPLNHYFIASSHNTYLEGNQVISNASVARYIQDLKSGCRCLELDCWDGPGVPRVFHGWRGTAVSGYVLFEDIVAAIAEFVQPSHYPVILSLENHTCIEQQKKMARYLRMYLKEKLECPVIGPDGKRQEIRDLPSPQSLMGKVLVKGKLRIHGEDVAPELASVILMPGVKFKELCSEHGGGPLDCASYKERKMDKILKKKNPDELIELNKSTFSRMYPDSARLDSSNFDPMMGWMFGCQLVAMNYQTPGIPMQLYRGRFLDNGRCGYVLKPRAMREEGQKVNYFKPISSLLSWGSVPPLPLTITIIGGQQLPKPYSSSQLLDADVSPYVRVEIQGIPCDHNHKETREVQGNGFNPIWNKTFQFMIHEPELALLNITVYNKGSAPPKKHGFIGSIVVPINCLRLGYRRVKLSNFAGESGGSHKYASLLVYISHQDKSTSRKSMRLLLESMRSLSSFL